MLYDLLILILFLFIPASAADAIAVSPKGINTFLANGITTFSINGNPVLIKLEVIYLKILLTVSCLIAELLKI